MGSTPIINPFLLFDDTMDPISTKNSIAFAYAATLAIHVLQNARKQVDKPPAEAAAHARKIAIAILEGSDQRFRDLFRLGKADFHRLVSWLRSNAGLKPSKLLMAEQKLMIVLWIFAHAEVQRNTAHRFGISQATVSHVVEELLPMLVALHKAFVRLPDDDWLDPTVELSPRLNAFNGCIGAIDGTHIAAHIPRHQQLRWRDRNGNVSQNVFAAVKTDFSFSYVLAGAEGSINDTSLCTQAFGRSFRVPENRYYLVDAGFGVRDGIVVPFPGVRYHLEDWRNADKPVETKKELYNLRHARLRVVVEQVFGQLKRRWKIIRVAAGEYSIKKQVQIVYAVTGLHNFLIAGHGEDALTGVQQDLLLLAKDRARRVVGRRHPDQIRWTAAHAMWENWQQWKRRVDS
ncbi:hypothetical protein VTI28DRAFT_1711 [Corynascus sepedonium]